ncbi:MAG: hypothetical protein AAGA90_20495 [Actinomycetota bacterium]
MIATTDERPGPVQRTWARVGELGRALLIIAIAVAIGIVLIQTATPAPGVSPLPSLCELIHEPGTHEMTVCLEDNPS